MKLFQQMLVAGASLSLIAPNVAQASDVVNLEEMNSYSSSKSQSSKIDSKTFINEVNEDIAKLKGRVDGLEVQQNEFEAGSFSDTTSLDTKAVFAVGAVENDSGDLSESTLFQYTYQMNLNTSFSGDDNLYVRLKTGNSPTGSPFKDKSYGTYLSSTNGNSDHLKVDKIWYTFPLGESNTVWIGPRIENYYMHGASPSIYSPTLKQFKLGGNGAAYGASTSTGVGWAYNAENGFSLSSNVVSKTAGSDSGFLTDESKTNWSTQVAYTTDRYHLSLLTAMKYNDWEDSYFSTSAGKARTGGSTNYGLRAYWRPEDSGTAVPELSFGYDLSTVEDQDADTDAYFVGLTWKDMFQASDKIGIALGRPQTSEDDSVDPLTWEAYYSFKPNDSVEIRPTVFGGTDRTGTSGDDVSGAVLETTFKF